MKTETMYKVILSKNEELILNKNIKIHSHKLNNKDRSCEYYVLAKDCSDIQKVKHFKLQNISIKYAAADYKFYFDEGLVIIDWDII